MKLATPEAFREDPSTVWEWYEHRRRLVADATPNDAHRALAELEARGMSVDIATQNVDDLHERAGSGAVTHVHGSLFEVRCVTEGDVLENRDIPLKPLPPECACGSLLRPNIVWFGEMLPEEAMARVAEAIEARPSLAFVVGTEASFGYITQWALAARERGALLVEVNPKATSFTPYADVLLQGLAGEVLPVVCEA
jgi:NAD-dependent deacetylase